MSDDTMDRLFGWAVYLVCCALTGTTMGALYWSLKGAAQ